MYLRTLLLFQFLHVLICQCIALPVEERDESKTYWVDPSCEAIGQGGFIRGITETIWTAGRIAESLYAFDGQLSDPGKALQWFFGVELQHHAARIAIAETYKRISQLQRINDRRRSNIRFVCNGDAEFKAVDKDGNEISEPLSDPAMRKTKYFNNNQDLYMMGTELCGLDEGMSGISINIQGSNSIVKLQPNSDQEPDRHLINLCHRYFLGMVAKNAPFTVLDLAAYRLETGVPFYNWDAAPMVLLTHELTHIPFLSSQTFTVPILDHDGQPGGSVQTNFHSTHAVDRHGPTKISGYFMDSPGLRSLPGSRLGSWEMAIMNSDSYAFFALVYRLRDRQWEAYKHIDQGEERILFRRNPSLPQKGDTWS